MCCLCLIYASSRELYSFILFNSHNNNTQQHRLSITKAIVQVSKLKAVVLIYTAYGRSHIEL